MAMGDNSKKGESNISIPEAQHFYLNLRGQYKDKKMILK
jgi:hypothetical protein